MEKVRLFGNYDQYEAWAEQFENCSDYESVPVLIDDGWKISADMFTECKSWKTALRRFEKAFGGIKKEVQDWMETMRESCEGGLFKDEWKPAWKQDGKEMAKGGTYSFGLEETSEGLWYVYLNISGVYAGREACNV